MEDQVDGWEMCEDLLKRLEINWIDSQLQEDEKEQSETESGDANAKSEEVATPARTEDAAA